MIRQVNTEINKFNAVQWSGKVKDTVDNDYATIQRQLSSHLHQLCFLFWISKYTDHLWFNYGKASLQKLKVAYNDSMRILLKRPWWCSASEMFVVAGVNTLQAISRKFISEFINLLNSSENEVIMALTSINLSTTRYQSKIWKHWYRCLIWGCCFNYF